MPINTSKGYCCRIRPTERWCNKNQIISKNKKFFSNCNRLCISKISFQDSQPEPINLFLHHIEFDKLTATDSLPKMPKKFIERSPFSVKWFQLKDTIISEIKTDALNSPVFRNLEHLEIFYCPLRVLKNGSFNGLVRLKILSMKGLKLNMIMKNVLAVMPKLEGFIVDDCGPNKISLNNLFGVSKLHNLKIISIQECNLSNTITNKTFSGVSSLTILALVFNRINSIAPNSFDLVLRTVETVYLGSNDLKTLPNDIFKTFRKIKVFLKDNPWHCDCQMENIRTFQETNPNVILNDIICFTPKQYEGVFLRNCPPLCKKALNIVIPNRPVILVPPVTAIEHQKIPVKIREDVTDRLKDKIDYMCKIYSSPHIKKLIKLSKPSHKIAPVNWIENQLYINTKSLSDDFKLVELNHIQSDDFDEIVFNIEKACATYIKSNRISDIKFERKLEQNNAYRFCWTGTGSATIVPLDCVTLYSGSSESNSFYFTYDGDNGSVWILKSQEPFVIIGWVAMGIFAIFAGILIAVALAKIFPMKIRGRMPYSRKPMSRFGPNDQKARLQYEFLLLKFFLNFFSKKNIEFIHNFRISNRSLRRRVGSSKRRGPAKQSSMDPIIFTSFEETEAPDYITIDEVTPPISPPIQEVVSPPKTMFTTNKDKFNCCNSEICECYCEL